MRERNHLAGQMEGLRKLEQERSADFGDEPRD